MRRIHRLSQGTLTLSLLLGTTLAFAQPKADEGEKKADEDKSEEEKSETKDEKETDKKPDGEKTEEEASSEDAKASEDEEKDSDKKEPSDEESASSSDEKSSEEGAGASLEKKPEAPPAPQPIEVKPPQESEKEDESLDPGPVASEEKTEEAAEAALTDLPEDKPSLTPFRVTTSTFSRFEVRENYDELGVSNGRTREGDQVVFRARLGLETNPLPIGDGSDVSIKFNPQASGRWGENGVHGEADWGIYEGYIHWRSPRLEAKVGRQMVTYGDEIIFGRAWWNEIGRAMDGARFRYKMNKGYLDAFVFQPSEVYPNGAARLLEGDEYLWGAYSGFGGYFNDEIETDLYFLGKTKIAESNVEVATAEVPVDIEGAHLFTFGGRVKHRVGFFDYRLEAGLQFGQTPRGELQDDFDWEAADALAYQVDGEFGFWLGQGTRIGLGGAYVSGDDPTTAKNEGWDHLYPAVHRWLGRMDVIGIRTNLIAGRMNIARNLTDELGLKIEAHVFARPQAGGRGQTLQIDASGQSVNNGADMAGVEVDTSLKHNLGKYSYVSALYGLFIPSTGHYQSDSLASYGELQAGVEF